MKEYKVTLIVTKQVSYLVDASSPEDAENIAEDLVREGEEPLESDLLEVEIEDVLPQGENDDAS